MNHEITTTEHPNVQRLSLHPMIWVLMGLTVLLVVRRAIDDQSQPESLNYSSDNRLMVIRSTTGVHRFDDLGINVEIPPGWAFLSVKDDVVANPLTFANSSAQVVVQVQPWSEALEKFEPSSAPPDAAKGDSRDGNSREPSVVWLDLELQGPPTRLRSGELKRDVLPKRRAQQWRFGHWSCGSRDLLVMVWDLRPQETPPETVMQLLYSLTPKS
ncbi:hypothetical protein [Rubripirellula amarantea]|nr:hypothetical protein [Rubripirellula amarantea]